MSKLRYIIDIDINIIFNASRGCTSHKKPLDGVQV